MNEDLRGNEVAILQIIFVIIWLLILIDFRLVKFWRMVGISFSQSINKIMQNHGCSVR